MAIIMQDPPDKTTCVASHEQQHTAKSGGTRMLKWSKPFIFAEWGDMANCKEN